MENEKYCFQNLEAKMCKTIDELIKKYKSIDKSKEEILDKLKSYKQDIKVIDWIPENEINVCFVFSCPGERELVKDQVCAGQTGVNLDCLLSFLNGKRSDIFPSKNRYDYIIMNASNQVHFPELTEDSEASREEIHEDNNIQRIKHIFENNSIEYVILFGKKAKSIKPIIKKTTSLDIKIVETIHLGNRSINSYKYTKKEQDAIEAILNDSKGRKEKRIEFIANNIIEKLS